MKKQMTKWVFLGIAGLSIFSSGSDVPLVNNVKMSQNQASRLVTISYEVAENPAIITLDIQTNGVSIGASNFRNVEGEVNKEVGVGAHTITWRPDRVWQGHLVSNATAKVCGWAKSSPPNYMAIHLIPSANQAHQVRWYTCEEALPEGIGSDIYREHILLMRRIYHPEGGKWVMGSPESGIGEGKRDKTCEMMHEVTLTNDYWMGVFEVTQKQWDLVKGGQPSNFKGENWASRPVERIGVNLISGGGDLNVPESDSFLGKLRQMMGNDPRFMFNLPSEMQWEYACRAGKSTALNSGADITKPDGRDPELDKVGRYRDNGGKKWDGNRWVVPGAEQTARVGSFQPNAWGLYDMHGNVCEWCLDLFQKDIIDLDGAVNQDTSLTDQVRRGGSWGDPAYDCRSASRKGSKKAFGFDFIGFRLVCPID